MVEELALQQPKKKSRKTLMPFKHEHASKYGLRIASRDASGSAVSSCVCRFCEVFGREESDQQGDTSRKKTGTIKHFETFRTDLYAQHLKKEHAERWLAYQQLCSEVERHGFFTQVAVPFNQTLAAHFDRSQPLKLVVNASIVEAIIGDLLFHPDDADGVTHSRALALFAVNGDGTYSVDIKTARRFELAVGMLATGSSFSHAARVLQLFRDKTGLAYIGGASDSTVANYARAACADALQKLSDIFDSLTGFSLAADSATVHGMSFMDVRARFTTGGVLHNFHLLALPLYDKHTGELLTRALIKFLDALHAPWRDILVGVATDGARSMTGRIRGVATLLEQEVSGRKLIRVWCGLHQLDLTMQRVLKAALDETFYGNMTAAIGHLRRQQNLVSEMRTTCPTVADTRWLSMGKCCRWFTANIINLQIHFNNKQPACAPDKTWWVFLFAVSSFAQEASKVAKALQGRTALMEDQRAKLLALVNKYCGMTKMVGPLSAAEVAAIDRTTYELSGQFALGHHHAHAFIEDLDVWVVEALSQLDADQVQVLAVAVAKLFVQGANGIYEIVAERTSAGGKADAMPSIRPSELVKMNMKEFKNLLDAHTPRLLKRMSTVEVHKIAQDFAALRSDSKGETSAMQPRGSVTATPSFSALWTEQGERFPALRNFCGDLASIFPNTATVESDFSVIGWERDVYRQRITNFSLEGVLQCKQYGELTELARRL